MSKKKALVNPEEIDSCLRYVSNNEIAQEQLLELFQVMQITLDEPTVEDSINGTRIRLTYDTAISRKKGGIDEAVIRFQYMKEISIDYNKVPINLQDSTTTTTVPAVDDTSPLSHKNDGIAEDTIIESYDELEKAVPKLYEILGHLKKIYFMPEDFSNRLVVDRLHKLRNMFSKDEILSFPSIDPKDKAGLIPI
ncbi:MAG TPA: hypothetical protein VFS97_11020 [Nitrososphaeraceae archaeon]|nr:hypothetical protein [Nitrososphaeraceae archaeon]